MYWKWIPLSSAQTGRGDSRHIEYNYVVAILMSHPLDWHSQVATNLILGEEEAGVFYEDNLFIQFSAESKRLKMVDGTHLYIIRLHVDPLA